MSTFKIPNNGQIRQVGRSDTLGEIKESFSIDINNPYGKIKPSKKLVKVLDESDFDGGTQTVKALAVYYKSGSLLAPKFYAISSGAVLRCTTSNDPTNPANWSEEIGIATSGFGDETDAVVFNDLLLISRSQNILSWNDTSDDNDWWTTVSLGGATGPALTSGFPHTMHVHHGGQETLFVTDGNKVHYANTTSGHNTVTLGTDMIACCVDSGVSAIWVGTYSDSSDNAYVYEMYVGETLPDGTSVARNAYKIDARAVLSITVLDNIPYIITDRGNLMRFNGAGFSTVQQLPFSGSSVVLDGVSIGNVDDDNDERPVHPKGMKAANDSIFISVRTQTDQNGFNQNLYAKNSPSGVYEYNTVTGQLHHRYAFANAATDNGAKVTRYGGPILIADNPYTFLMAGAEINDTTAGLFMETDSQYGYFVTTEIMSDSVTDSFESTYIKSKLLSGNDSITLKYRTEKKEPTQATVALADSNVINTTDAVTAEIGDEVTIIDGPIAGKIAHIVDISTSATVTSITLDTDIGTAGQIGVAEFINFKLFANKSTNPPTPDRYTSANKEVKRWGGIGTHTWVQYKVIMDGDVEIREFISKGNSKDEL